MSATLATLTKKRKSLLKALQRFQTYLQKYTEANANELATRLQSILPLSIEFEEIQSKIEDFDEADENDEIHTASRTEFENLYFKVTLEADSKLRLVRNTSTPISQLFNNSTVEAKINLPTLQLPTFEGRYDQWAQFRDRFQSIVHNNANISDVQKLHYLQSAIKGAAGKVIHSLDCTHTNYLIAWNLLTKRYENNRLTINGHLSAIFDFPAISKENYSQLREFTDTLIKTISSLKALKLHLENTGTDAILNYVIVSKLDATTNRKWEALQTKDKFQTVQQLLDFLNQQCDLLEAVEQTSTNKQVHTQNAKYTKTRSFTAFTDRENCVYCGEKHSIYRCNKFIDQTFDAKEKFIMKKRLCFNCLQAGHMTRACTSRGCRKCGRFHHTALHAETGAADARRNTDLSQGDPTTGSRPTDPESHHNKEPHRAVDRSAPSCVRASQQGENETGTTIALTNQCISNANTHVLLSTAKARIRDADGQLHTYRILLDSGSQSNFITQRACDELRLPKERFNSSVTGICENASTTINYKTNVEVYSEYNGFKRMIQCLVIPQITDNLPSFSFNANLLHIPNYVRLADDSFNKSGRIDMLIGATLFWDIMESRSIRLGETGPVLRQTKFGWIIGGTLQFPRDAGDKTQTFCTLQKTLTKFWEIENMLDVPRIESRDEAKCEELFTRDTRRQSDGRFIVKLPLRENLTRLGNSRELALKRFYSLEKQLTNNATMKKQYTEFMREYRDLGHMHETNEDTAAGEISFYLPHHAVTKADSLSTKQRTVFDASLKTDTELSLNDTQYVGPTVQRELFDIILGFRKHSFVMCADIEKMYRMINIDESQCKLQRIFWREHPSEKLRCWELQTITYGMAASPFLATRCLKQLAIDFKDQYPKASAAIQNDFYVDDLLTGANSIEETKKLRQEIIEILQTAKFNLRKWTTNDARIIERDDANTNDVLKVLSLKKDDINKTLGILWNPNEDTLQYNTKRQGVTENARITKRTILSEISKIYDPLGLLAPIIILAKILMQALWKEKLSWDEELPEGLRTRWMEFQEQLHTIDNMRISRKIICNNATAMQLVGFSDASQVAYGACVYLRSCNNEGKYFCNLVCAKSKVAPVRTTSLPRLELCAAVLLARLSHRVRNALQLQIDKCYYWSDSTIVLCWIQADPARWTTFVSNRVAEIQDLTEANEWNHIDTAQNAADVLSRGTTPQGLTNHKLWWHAPTWLSSDVSQWPSQADRKYIEIVEERREKIAVYTTVENDFFLIDKFSSFERLQRVTAYMIRFMDNARKTQERKTGHLTIKELHRSTAVLTRIAQRDAYSRELADLRNKRELSNANTLSSLSPYIDEEGNLRVGGRLQKSDLSNEQAHQIILPSKHNLTKLIARSLHKTHLHCGPQMLLAVLRYKYWPIAGRNLTRKTVHECITCFKAKPISISPKMGELPRERLVPMPAFARSGVDYAGPFIIKDKKTRGNKDIKCYVCIFICLVTKAVHIELAADLSANAYIAALRRFVARRGKPNLLVSDNGTNFVGTKIEIRLMLQRVSQGSDLNNWVSENETEFKFIPPRSPHFGGIWERAVQSVKFHLKRITSSTRLIYEEFLTILTQIEAILNSRPLYPLSSDHRDLNPLTPAHFLIGRPLTAVPDENLVHIACNRLNRYQALQQLVQGFWKRWRMEYLNELQQRTKWKKAGMQLQVGDMVILKEDNTPPCNWKLGRVTTVSAGSDNVVRVAEVLTNKGLFKRAVRNLCVLPREDAM